MIQRLITRFQKETDKKYILYLLGVIAFFESVIFPIPVDIFTFTLVVAHPKKWLRYATVATVGSVFGAVFGYILGLYLFSLFGEQIIAFYGYEQEFIYVTELFRENVFWVMFVAAFIPIPYKIFTLAAGALNVFIIPFVVASVIGRGLRFFIGAYLPYRYGEVVGRHLLKNINIYSFVLILVAIMFFVMRTYLES